MDTREATLDDVLDILRLGRQFCMALDEKYDRASIVDHAEWLIETDICTAILAENDDGKVVGMVSGVCIPTYFNASRLMAAEMWWWVDVNERGSGIGIALLDALESWARAAGAERLSMMIMEQLDSGIEKVYLQRGYRPHERTFLKEL